MNANREIVAKLKKIVKKTLPDSTEAIKWGMPTFSLNGKILGNVGEYNDHVNLYFFKGAMLKSKLLEGTGKGLRHIKISKETEIKEKEIARLLNEAAKIV